MKTKTMKGIMPIPTAIAVEISGNRKLGLGISATYAAQASCPKSCPFQGAGCYAESGFTGITTHRLNRAVGDATELTTLRVATDEALAIGQLSGRFPLRLHVVGDCSDERAVSVVAHAAHLHMAKRGQPVWTYTHAEGIPRAAWGKVSVLRSVESVAQLKPEHERGYALALVMPTPHDGRKAVNLGDGFTGIPCPQQTGAKSSCEECRLCFDDQKLRDRKLVVLFAPDGSTGTKIRKALNVLQ